MSGLFASAAGGAKPTKADIELGKLFVSVASTPAGGQVLAAIVTELATPKRKPGMADSEAVADVRCMLLASRIQSLIHIGRMGG